MIYQVVGLSLFLLGCGHLYSRLSIPEARLVITLQSLLSHQPWINLFQELWFLGRTSFTILSLVFLAVYDWMLGLTASLVFLVMVGIEQLVKQGFKRPRPFICSREITMVQPLEPTDPSFPSGDTLRIVYLALVIPAAAGGSPSLLLAAGLVAALVSLGRMVMGVHFLTDVLAGAGLGAIGAGTAVWLWTLLGLY